MHVICTFLGCPTCESKKPCNRNYYNINVKSSIGAKSTKIGQSPVSTAAKAPTERVAK